MRVLLDESLSGLLAPAITGHDVQTVRQMGWLGIGNGALLRRAVESGFEAMVTADRSIEHQQNLAKIGIGLVVLVARKNRIEDHLPLLPELLEALATIQPGQVVHVGPLGRA
jgi:hypothetical protein